MSSAEIAQGLIITRLGFKVRLGLGLKPRARWFGLGPHETYSDRVASAHVGIFEMTTDNMTFPYGRPQESGHREQVRWVAVTGEDGHGLLVSAKGAELFGFGLSQYGVNEVDCDPPALKHFPELTPLPNGEVELHIDHFMMGIGCVNTWGALPLSPHFIRARPGQSWSWHFRLRELRSPDDPRVLGVQAFDDSFWGSI